MRVRLKWAERAPSEGESRLSARVVDLLRVSVWQLYGKQGYRSLKMQKISK